MASCEKCWADAGPCSARCPHLHYLAGNDTVVDQLDKWMAQQDRALEALRNLIGGDDGE